MAGLKQIPNKAAELYQFRGILSAEAFLSPTVSAKEKNKRNPKTEYGKTYATRPMRFQQMMKWPRFFYNINPADNRAE